MNENKTVWDRVKSVLFKTYDVPSFLLYQTPQASMLHNTPDAFLKEGYMVNGVVYAAIDAIAQGVAELPIKLYKVKANGEEEEVENHPVLDLLRNPSPNTSTFYAYVYQWVSYLLATGNSYTYLGTPTGEATGKPALLFLLQSQRVTIKEGRFYQGVKYYQYEEDGHIDKFPPEAILHARRFNPLSHYKGMPPLQAVVREIDQHNAAGTWNVATLQNGGMPRHIITMKGRLSPEARTQIEQDFQSQHGQPQAQGGISVYSASEGMDVSRIAQTPQEMDWLGGRRDASGVICAALRVPPQILGLEGSQTFANYEQARIALYEDAVLPVATEFAQSHTQALLPRFKLDVRGPSHYELRFDTSAVPALAANRDLVEQRNQRRLSAASEAFQKGIVTLRQAQEIAGIEDADQAPDLYIHELTTQNRPNVSTLFPDQKGDGAPTGTPYVGTSG